VHLFKRPDFAAHYTVEDPRENLNIGEFNSYMNSLVTKLTAHPENYSSFFLFVLSHGDENGVHAYYKANCDQPDVIPYDEIAKKFSNCLPGDTYIYIYILYTILIYVLYTILIYVLYTILIYTIYYTYICIIYYIIYLYILYTILIYTIYYTYIYTIYYTYI